MINTVKKLVAEMDEYHLEASSKIGLFGAGYFCACVCDYLSKTGYTVTCCIDNFKTGTLNGIPIVSITDEVVSQLDIIFITPLFFAAEISRQLLSVPNTRTIPHVYWDKYFVQQRLDSYLEVRDALYDNRSKEILDGLLLKALQINCDYSDIYEDKQYFALPPFVICHNETFVNAGAFCGDTVESFVYIHKNVFNKIFAFEPGKKMFSAMQKRVARLVVEWGLDTDKIILSNSALSDKIGSSYLSSSDLPMARILKDINETEAGDIVPVTTIDAVCKNEKITLLAADIEGHEMQMLHGGAATIQRDRPKLALSIYHRPDDLFEIMAFCKAMYGDYKFSLRHHLPSIGDTVLYCY